MAYNPKILQKPKEGEEITIKDNKLHVPNYPIIPFIEGDGIGSDITPAMIKVVDSAVQKAYKGEKKSHGMKCLWAKNAIKNLKIIRN